MTPGERFRRSLSTSFRIHLILMALSSLPAYLATSSIRAITMEHPLGDPLLTAPGLAPLLEGFSPIASSGFAIGSIALTIFLALTVLALTPWLLMSWCCAMHPSPAAASPDSDAPGHSSGEPPSAWREGWSHYLSAFMTSLFLSPIVLVAVAWACLFPIIVNALEAGLTPGLTLLLTLVPALTLWVFWGALHDLSRAGLVHGDGVGATIRHACGGRRWRRLASYCTWSTASLLAAFGANAAAFLLDGPSALQSAAAIIIGQCLLFGRTLARARWLASAIHYMTPPRQT